MRRLVLTGRLKVGKKYITEVDWTVDGEVSTVVEMVKDVIHTADDDVERSGEGAPPM